VTAAELLERQEPSALKVDELTAWLRRELAETQLRSLQELYEAKKARLAQLEENG
jgi:hypothetical protein